MFFKWLTRRNIILYNPASELDFELPRIRKTLPKQVLSQQEAETVINTPEVDTVLGLRDRAILETFYCTGIRRNELLHLKLYDVDRGRKTLLVREGKGKRERYVPIGERALRWIEKYLAESRPELVVEPDEGFLFLSNMGEPFTPDRLTQLARYYVKKAGVAKRGCCHIFRHTMATLMLENGADIRYIQLILGHESIATTEVYTHVSIQKLQEVHRATHPGANLGRSGTGQEVDPEGEMLAMLEAEAEEEEAGE